MCTEDEEEEDGDRNYDIVDGDVDDNADRYIMGGNSKKYSTN